MTKLKLSFFWVLNLFTLSKPSFLRLKHVDFVIDNKAYFLISWEIKKAYCLYIPELRFQSFKKHASAYIAIPNTINKLTVKVSNSWGTKIEMVKLLRTEMTNQTEFDVQLNDKEFNKNSVLIPEIYLDKKTLKIKTLSIKTINVTIPKIKNLNYSKN